MSDQDSTIERRHFLQLMAAAGLSPLVASAAQAAAAATSPATAPADGLVPKRKLGRTGVEIPILAVGAPRKAEVMDRALEYGFTHWDSATSYGNEGDVGKYLKQHAGLRDKLFLSTKPPDIPTPLPVIKDTKKFLEQSLKNFGTDYIDLYLGVHAMPKADCLTDELRKFAEDEKKKGTIKFFGFSTHANQAQNLAAAAKLDWIDALLVSHCYRQVSTPNAKLEEAIAACHTANIGLIAIKLMGGGPMNLGDAEKKLAKRFLDRGFDAPQAKMKMLLEDTRFSSGSVGMSSVAIVDNCAGAALDKAKLTADDRRALRQFAQSTGHTFCAGCAQVCGAALPAGLPMISDIMRYMMYHENYGPADQVRARALFAEIPHDVRQRLLAADYAEAEARCPQKIAIGDMVAQACRTLA